MVQAPVRVTPLRVAQALLDAAHYRRFLAATHPALGLEDERLEGVPSFVAPLDVREPMPPGPWRRLLSGVHVLSPAWVRPSALFVGTPFERYEQTHVLDDVDCVDGFSDVVQRAARRLGLEVVVITNLSPTAIGLDAWRRRGWVVFPSFPDAVVDLKAADFQAHLRTLPQGDRSGVRRNIRRFERAGHGLERVMDARGLGSELFECYRPLYRRAAVRWHPHTRAYFSGLPGLGESVHLTVARSRAGALIGFIVAFEDREGVQAGRIGVHPNYHRRDAVYFRLLYHVLEGALASKPEGNRVLSLEPTGYRMKRHLGARTVPLVNLIMGVSETWSILLHGMQGLGQFMLRHLNDPGALERWC